MSLKTEGISCARCHAYLFDEDDIVYCPVCGAPHHRDCYNAEGHCALEQFHGTPEQYDLIKEKQEVEKIKEPEKEHTGENAEGEISCQMCHEKYDFKLNSCPKCGAPNIAKAGGSFVNFDFLGGVPADYDIGETVTADEAKRFVVANTQRYIPKFATLNKTNRASWNWAAFFFPCGWMLSRKMYKSGIIAGILTVIAALFTLPFNTSVYNLGLTDASNYMDVVKNIYQNLPKIGTAIMAAAMVGALFNIIIRVISAVFGDYLYKNHTISEIKTIRAESEDMDYDYRKKGGVNFFMFILGVMMVEYLPMIITMFL